MNAPIFPDALKALIDFMSTHTYLTTFGVTRVAPNLNGYTEDMKWVEVHSSPGNRVETDRLDRLPFDLNCYGPTFGDSLDLARYALAAGLSSRGLTVTGPGGLVVTQTEVAITPYNLTDQLSNRYRHVCSVVLYVRPI